MRKHFLVYRRDYRVIRVLEFFTRDEATARMRIDEEKFKRVDITYFTGESQEALKRVYPEYFK